MMSRPPDRRRGPGGVTTPHQGPSVEPPSHVTDIADVQRGDLTAASARAAASPFDATDEDALQHCAELAQRGAA